MLTNSRAYHSRPRHSPALGCSFTPLSRPKRLDSSLIPPTQQHKKKRRGGLPPAYHEVSTLGGTARHPPTAPPAEGLPTAHAVHLDDLEKNASSSVATAHPLGTTTGGGMPSGTSKTSLAAGAAAGAAATAAVAAGVAALAGHNKNRKPEDHSLPEVGW